MVREVSLSQARESARFGAIGKFQGLRDVYNEFSGFKVKDGHMRSCTATHAVAQKPRAERIFVLENWEPMIIG